VRFSNEARHDSRHRRPGGSTSVLQTFITVGAIPSV